MFEEEEEEEVYSQYQQGQNLPGNVTQLIQDKIAVVCLDANRSIGKQTVANTIDRGFL